ncbi:FAD-binding 8 [Akanthomyces lecanii RCEF 1005]|uniref:FAD-binding 8 n=1 Tax=Akanthomyces lecanii RCEF 1005 TaxID=1081108 RepID=A0A167XLF6_CORDF|nr:FAD-binding 8 [Akanthomyces lecanii RCEF 1005]
MGSLDLTQAGRRAGRLALANAVVLYAGLHLGSLADMVGAQVLTYRRIHSSVSLIVFMLAAFHAIVALLDGKARFQLTTKYLFALLAAAALSFMSLVFPLVRHLLWYEFAMCLHKVVAVGLAYAALQHVGSDARILAIPAGVYLVASSLVTLLTILYRHNLQPCTATVTYDGDTTFVSLNIPGREVQVDAGQYVELWMPLNAEHGAYCSGLPEPQSNSPRLLARLSTFWRRAGYPLSTFTWWQSHPLMVASWSEQPASDLSLVVQPKDGWTKRLHTVAKLHFFNKLLRWKKLAQLLREQKKSSDERGKSNKDRDDQLKTAVNSLLKEVEETVLYKTLALFSGPHGLALETDGYRNVFVVARSTFIFACMPFVRRIISENRSSPSQSRLRNQRTSLRLERFHLVYETTKSTWESKEIDDFIKEIPVDDDPVSDIRSSPGAVRGVQTDKAFEATVYAPIGKEEEVLTPRAKMKNGPMDLETVLAEEMDAANGRRTLILGKNQPRPRHISLSRTAH